jgi:hypothetical protein
LKGVLKDLQDFVGGTQAQRQKVKGWRDDLELESLCSKLSKNDQALTRISAESLIDGFPFGISYAVPNGNARSLCLAEALKGNTHVSTLDISMKTLQSGSPTTMESCNGWTTYIRESKALRTLHVSWYDYHDFGHDQDGTGIVMRSLLDAIDANKGLEAVHFVGWPFAPRNKLPCTRLAQLLRTERMLRALVIDPRQLSEDKALLAHALGTNRSLKSISLTMDAHEDWALVLQLGLIPSLEEVLLRRDEQGEVDDAFFGLHRVCFVWGDYYKYKNPPLTSAQDKVLSAYGQRNQILRAFLSKRPEARTDWRIFPTLLAVAGTMGKGASRTATLLGLIALDSCTEH